MEVIVVPCLAAGAPCVDSDDGPVVPPAARARTGRLHMPSSLLRRKDVDACQKDAERSEHRLKRSLGVFNLTALGIGAVIGAGIFSADRHARPRAGRTTSPPVRPWWCRTCWWHWRAASRPSATPRWRRWSRWPGSAYTYAYVTLGELVAWIIGWDLILEYAVGNVAVAVSWADYFKSLLAGLGAAPARLAVDHGGPRAADPGPAGLGAAPLRHPHRPQPAGGPASSRCSPCCW